MSKKLDNKMSHTGDSIYMNIQPEIYRHRKYITGFQGMGMGKLVVIASGWGPSGTDGNVLELMLTVAQLCE